MATYTTSGEIAGGVGFGTDEYPSEYQYYNDFDIIGNGSTTYNRDPYIPIENEPIGYGYAAKNFESSLDSVSPYRYQPNPAYEEKYYPASMLEPDRRTRTQYERFTNPMSQIQDPATNPGAPWWMPSYQELAIMFVIVVMILILTGWSQNAEITRLREKVDRYKTVKAVQTQTSKSP
jgi:hypothetical protein